MNIFFTLIGNVGVVCFLFAFFMLQKEKMRPDDYSYLGLNLAGSVLLLASLCWDFNLAAFILEALWGVISSYGMVKRWQKDRRAAS